MRAITPVSWTGENEAANCDGISLRTSAKDGGASACYLGLCLLLYLRLARGRHTGAVFSGVLDFTLDHGGHTSSLGQHGEAGNTEWRNLLRSFNNVRTLRVHGGVVGDLFRPLRWNGEPLLPEPKEVVCPGGDHAGDALIAFINARQVASQPRVPVHADFLGSLPTRTGKSLRVRLGRFSRLWS